MPSIVNNKNELWLTSSKKLDLQKNFRNSEIKSLQVRLHWADFGQNATSFFITVNSPDLRGTVAYWELTGLALPIP